MKQSGAELVQVNIRMHFDLEALVLKPEEQDASTQRFFILDIAMQSKRLVSAVV